MFAREVLRDGQRYRLLKESVLEQEGFHVRYQIEDKLVQSERHAGWTQTAAERLFDDLEAPRAG